MYNYTTAEQFVADKRALVARAKAANDVETKRALVKELLDMHLVLDAKKFLDCLVVEEQNQKTYEPNDCNNSSA